MSEHRPWGNVYFPLTAFTPCTNQIFTTKELFSMHHHLSLNNMTQERGYIFKEAFDYSYQEVHHKASVHRKILAHGTSFLEMTESENKMLLCK